MRKLFLVAVVMLSGFAFAQPVINTPTPLQVCDDDLDGISTFNLHSKDTEVLGLLNPINYNISYHLSNANAQSGTFPITSIYSNTIPFSQVFFVRLFEISSGLYSTAPIQVNVGIKPSYNFPSNLSVFESPFDAVTIFDLSTQNANILVSTTTNIKYFTTEVDANSGINFILNPQNYTNTSNPQRIFARISDNLTGCFSITSFLIIVNSTDIINIPDPFFKAKLLSSSSTNNIAENLAGNFFKIDANNDGEIQVNEALEVKGLDVSNSNIADMTGINSFSFLQTFIFNNNNITELNLNGLNYYGDFNFNSSISSCLNLHTINLSNLHLFGAVSLSNLPQLNNINFDSIGSLQIDINHCGLTNVTIENCNNLHYITLNYNNINNLILNGLSSLSDLNVNYNQISILNIQNLTNLRHLDCESNLLSTLDITNNSKLFYCYFTSNPLVTLFLKNGILSQFPPMVFGTGSLVYVCIDNFNIGNDLDQVNPLNFPNVVINSYCSFTPGGTYNTITGTTHFDRNNNGCDNSDPIVQNQRIDIADGSSVGATFTNNVGNYIFYVQQPNLTLTPYLENPTYFTVTPPTANFNFPTNNNSSQTQDFCINANGIHNDLEIVIAPIGAARPGFDANYQLVYKNKGNLTLSGTINLTFDDAKTDFVSALPTFDSQTVNNLSWNYANLLPFESRVIDVVLNLNSPIETPAVNSGDVLNFTTTINPVVGDDLPLDNVFDYHQTVINSFDPNIITCLEGDSLPPTAIGEYVHYTVQFENTGTASAVNVVVNDVIDATKYDISTLQVLNSSNNVRTDINNDTVEFIFQNINLAAVTGTPPVGGHGDVLFKIKTKSSLIAGDNVLNKAKIFFDYNAPIVTNDAITTFAVLNNSVFVIDNSVSVSPNPATSKININTINTVKSIEVYDIQGRILETVLNANSIDISDKSNGIYFLKITTDIGSKIEKVVKE